MNEDEKMEIFQMGVKECISHSKPSPETDRRMAILETNFSNINQDLKDIKTAITRSTIWLITALFTFIISSFSLAFWIGSWKGSIEVKIDSIEKRIDVIDRQHQL